MAFSAPRTSRVSSGDYVTYSSFFIAVSNYPDIIAHARQNPLLNQLQRQQQSNQAAMFIPDVRVHYGASYAEIYETLLYNTLRYQLREAIRAYLQRTQRAYPIIFVFDFPAM